MFQMIMGKLQSDLDLPLGEFFLDDDLEAMISIHYFLSTMISLLFGMMKLLVTKKLIVVLKCSSSTSRVHWSSLSKVQF